MYLCYDVRGIQRYIFAVPKLKYVVGASSLIVQFDSESAPKLAKDAGVERIATGGGRGTFVGLEKQLAVLLSKLVTAAHGLGLDLRIGVNDDLWVATSDAAELWPVWIDNLEGKPCSVSGMFPVAPGKGHGYFGDRQTIHQYIWKRISAAREDRLGQSVHADLLKVLKGPLLQRKLEFFKNLDIDEADDDEGRSAVQRATESLDEMNNYAIIAMDGNDIGEQLLRAASEYRNSDAFITWLKIVGESLAQCTRSSLSAGLSAIIQQWWSKERENKSKGGDPVTLPVRPLIVGGDDLLLLMHPKYAIIFVREAIKAFQKTSSELHNNSLKGGGPALWTATGGSLSISAGIAIVNIKFPLNSGIGIAESLLAQAKHRGRSMRNAQGFTQPTPPALDWEQITEGAIDTTADSRNREMVFRDGDDGETEIRLTRRPYLFTEMEKLAEGAKTLLTVPPGIRQELLPGLRQPKWKRKLFIERLRHNHPELASRICNDFDTGNSPRSTSVIDTAMLLNMGAELGVGNDQ